MYPCPNFACKLSFFSLDAVLTHLDDPNCQCGMLLHTLQYPGDNNEDGDSDKDNSSAGNEDASYEGTKFLVLVIDFIQVSLCLP